MFVSHLGCTHRCVFCDQTQFSPPIGPERIVGLVSDFLAGCRRPGERRRILAFYGGAFTGIEPPLLERYLHEARRLVDEGVIHGVKASTRPDMITEEVLERCREAGFVELEIGAQSMDDEVLRESRRGHGTSDVARAARLVRSRGLKLGIQLMPGLPGEDRRSFVHTVEQVVRLKPDNVRLYPAVVLEGTALEQRHRRGEYAPLDLDEAILRCLYGYAAFTGAGCRVLRMGLPSSENLAVAAGPFHPCFGFLVKARGYRIMASVLGQRFGTGLHLEVNPGSVPELLGFKGENIHELGFSYSFDPRLPRDYMQVRGASERGCLQLKDIIEYIL
ncbi:MAG: radical SAM protein [Desulfomonilia bacterium]